MSGFLELRPVGISGRTPLRRSNISCIRQQEIIGTLAVGGRIEEITFGADVILPYGSYMEVSDFYDEAS